MIVVCSNIPFAEMTLDPADTIECINLAVFKYFNCANGHGYRC